MSDRATSWASVLTPGDGDPRHGMNGYSNLGCRCDICREANTAYNLSMREVRARRIAADPSIRPHGVETTYLNYRCRCAECRAEHNRRQKMRAAARGNRQGAIE